MTPLEAGPDAAAKPKATTRKPAPPRPAATGAESRRPSPRHQACGSQGRGQAQGRHAKPVARARARASSTCDRPTDEAEIEASRAPLMDHLIELRGRLIVCVVAFVLAFFVCFFFAAQIQIFLIKPFQAAAALHAEAQATGAHGGNPFDLIAVTAGLQARSRRAASRRSN